MNSALSVNQMTPGTHVKGAIGNRRQPATQEQDCRHGAHGRDRHVFAEHEHHVGRRAVLDHEAGDQFGFRFHQIEGEAALFTTQ